MVLNLQKKEEIVCKFHEITKRALSAVVATLEGIRVNEMTQLRKEARNFDVGIYVIRNTLMRRVLDNTSFVCLKDILIGQNVIAFSIKQPGDAARICVEFGKKNDNFKIKGAVFDGKFITSSRINFLSNLPTYEEAVLKLVSVIKISGIGSLIRVLYMLSMLK